MCAKKLAKREVTRVRRGKIEETRFLLATTEVAEGFEIFRADHSERMSSMISGSDIANPVWALAAKPVPVANTCQGESEPPRGRS